MPAATVEELALDILRAARLSPVKLYGVHLDQGMMYVYFTTKGLQGGLCARMARIVMVENPHVVGVAYGWPVT